ncbi:hypothetical protein COL68_09830 [Bacillus wiedmannii]|jgi:hypothetical protein|uniref:Uncharacterized protein n=2 Tax=Bacillus cereus group TaxID=86661 RepID=R8DD12_BACCE|nr:MULTISPECIES: hypothetical protein [Bacillus]EEL72224.1 hypothetical protein bcere0026_8470 [Bacillus mycoides]EOO21627.1 hypothetical protein IGA_01298 [Bacillus cereus HuA3-9]KMP92771.1 hypothetical protein TU65_19270 [Bacillus wiedmannii]MBK5431405.1 hypothetical protein [Bacillus sp. TH25]MCQ6569015.1 hypothetical protein [Bacillus mycoides]
MCEIKDLFQKLIEEYYEKEDTDFYVVDTFPKIVKSEKYFDFEENILLQNKYNILNKSVLALSKLYLYDENIYILDNVESLNYSKYTKSITEFNDDVLKFLPCTEVDKLILVFSDLKIGVIIGDGCFAYVSFESKDLKLVEQLCISEGLFVAHTKDPDRN